MAKKPSKGMMNLMNASMMSSPMMKQAKKTKSKKVNPLEGIATKNDPLSNFDKKQAKKVVKKAIKKGK